MVEITKLSNAYSNRKKNTSGSTERINLLVENTEKKEKKNYHCYLGCWLLLLIFSFMLCRSIFSAIIERVCACASECVFMFVLTVREQEYCMSSLWIQCRFHFIETLHSVVLFILIPLQSLYVSIHLLSFSSPRSPYIVVYTTHIRTITTSSFPLQTSATPSTRTHIECLLARHEHIVFEFDTNHCAIG